MNWLTYPHLSLFIKRSFSYVTESKFSSDAPVHTSTGQLNRKCMGPSLFPEIYHITSKGRGWENSLSNLHTRRVGTILAMLNVSHGVERCSLRQ